MSYKAATVVFFAIVGIASFFVFQIKSVKPVDNEMRVLELTKSNSTLDDRKVDTQQIILGENLETLGEKELEEQWANSAIAAQPQLFNKRTSLSSAQSNEDKLRVIEADLLMGYRPRNDVEQYTLEAELAFQKSLLIQENHHPIVMNAVEDIQFNEISDGELPIAPISSSVRMDD